MRALAIVSNDAANRDTIAGAIRAALPEIDIVSDGKPADAILVVTFSSQTVEEAPESSGCGCPADASARREANPTQVVTKAVASVVRPAGADTYRRLLSSNWSHASTLVVCRQIAQHFAMTYRKANRN